MIDESLSIHALFMRQVAARPAAIAVLCGAESLSYAELHRQQLALAVALRRRAIGAGQVVGVYLERGPALLAATLALVGAGAVFLLLDAAMPPERLARIVEQSGMRHVITRRTMPGLPGKAALGEVYLDDRADVGADADAGPAPVHPPDAPCYLIFTSGSTGTPKGVQLSRGGLSHVAQAMAAEIGLDESDNVLMLSSVGFDISLLELLMPLVGGACVTIVPQAALGDVAAIRAIVDDAAVTVVQATPSSFQVLTAGGWSPRRRLKILCGGEVLPPGLLAPLLRLGDRIWHVYGPTETTIWSLAQRIENAGTPVRLGKPIGRTEVRILDAGLGPVGQGEAGELYIGGAGVAIGYLSGDRQRFVALAPAGALFFRTGDRVRRGALGLEFLGRSDRQVKIRGHRIELDEVEALLRAHPMVAAAAVTAQRVDGVCTATLAYLVLKPLGGASPGDFADLAIADIKRWLGRQLAPAAVPPRYLVLEALPMSSSGKLDYAALPAVAPVASDGGDSAPASVVERKLAAIWRQTLRLDQIDLDADFFSVGGDSLLAAMLAFDVQNAFGIDFSINTVVENSSLRSMAERIAEAPQAGVDC